MKRSEFRTALRLDLSDLDLDSPKYEDDALDRAIERAICDIDRLLPQEKMYEATLVFAVEDEAFTPIAFGTPVQLANKPIKYNSETVKHDVTVYVRDTDYTMDYSNGTITAITGGGMGLVANTMSYTRDELSVDVSGIEGLVRIDRVEYPLGQVPQTLVSWEEFGGVLRITSARQGQSQARLTVGEHVGIYYQAINERPDDASDGTLPDFMSEVAIKGGLYYILLTKVLEHLQLSADSMTNATTDMTDAKTALTEAQTALEDSHAYLTDAGQGYDKVDDQVDAASTALGNIGAAIVGIETAINEMGTPDGTGVMHSINEILDFVITLHNGMTGFLEGAGGITGAKTHLEVGDDLINAVTVGADAANLRRLYADSSVSAARAYIEESSNYLGLGDRWNFLLTASIQKALRRVDIVTNYINEAGTRVQMATAYNTAAAGRVNMAQVKVSEAQAHIQRAQILASNATTDSDLSSHEMDLATRYREESISRRDEYITVLRDRSQWMQDYRSSARRQIRT